MKMKQILGLIIAMSFAIGVGMLAMTLQKFPDHSLLRQVMFGLSGAMTTLSVGAGVLFLLGRQDFKAGPRKAYALLCVGVILIGVSQIQFPLIEFFELRDKITSFFGLIGLMYLLAVIFTILGMRMLVRSLGLTTRWGSLLWLFGTASVAAASVAVLSALLPHDRFDPQSFTSVQINGTFGVWTATLYLLAARLAWLTRQEVGARYKPAMTWLFAGLVTVGFSALHLYGATRFFHDTWYEQDSVSTIPLFVASVLLVVAGYATLAIRRRFEVAPSTAVAGSGNTFLNVVMYAASLASTPHNIDHALDTVRKVTATTADWGFSPVQERALCQTYGIIEDYLVTREPMRPFDVEELRDQITKTFNLTPELQAKLWGAAA